MANHMLNFHKFMMKKKIKISINLCGQKINETKQLLASDDFPSNWVGEEIPSTQSIKMSYVR